MSKMTPALMGGGIMKLVVTFFYSIFFAFCMAIKTKKREKVIKFSVV